MQSPIPVRPPAVAATATVTATATGIGTVRPAVNWPLLVLPTPPLRLPLRLRR